MVSESIRQRFPNGQNAEPARPVGGDTREALREEWARKLFHEFVTGLPSAWTSDHGQNAHYRAECYRVVDELLAAVGAALAAQETVRRVEALLEEWDTIARSYSVMDERDKASEARQRAKALCRALRGDR